MRILALDIGKRRTGVAYLDEDVGIVLPLDTVEHASEKEFREQVLKILRERKIDRLVVGLPLLPTGAEGSQSSFVRMWAALLDGAGVPVLFRDERYTTPRPMAKNGRNEPGGEDGDAAAACEILRSLGSS
ncbi:MAG: Holliday junction resolvase RuvX [Candidatus Peribacteraceae bacterium]|nr:Holliday junction resolvase RuvX [Candidatus Peribacteraceae bacterium]